MGFARYNSTTFDTYASTHALRSASTRREEIFRETRINQYLDPKGVTVRESRDSEQNPNSTAIIVGIDVTGSMGMIAEALVREGVDAFARGLYERRPVSDPHLLFAGIGDVECDRAPLQVSQFEADIRIVEQLRLMYLEGGGGGNDHESYALPWYFAAKHTSIDCWERRQKKGYLFTVGDELPQLTIRRDEIQHVTGTRPQAHVDVRELLREVQEKYHVFHLIATEGSYARSHGSSVTRAWRDLLGNHAIELTDYKKMAQVLTSIIQVTEGATPDAAVEGYDPEVRNVVTAALTGLGAPGRRVDLA
jgi:hypothetical protein